MLKQGQMNKIPIILTFDKNMSLAAAVCISSMMESARADTFYDFFVLYSNVEPDIVGLDKILDYYPNMRLTYRDVGNIFDNAYQVRGITTAAYYRLLTANVVPEYDKVIYADVDMIFRLDLSDLYNYDLSDNYFGAVYAINMNIDSIGIEHVKSIGLKEGDYYLSGFLLMNLKKIREGEIISNFIKLASNNYKYHL